MASQLSNYYAAHTGGSEMSLKVSQLLGPEDGLKVVALLDGVAHGQKPRCIAPSFLRQASRSQTAPKPIPMSKDVPAAASCASQDEVPISRAATVCVACAPSTSCLTNALDGFSNIMQKPAPTSVARVVEPNSSHAGAIDGSRQAAGCHSALTGSSGEITET